MDVATIVSSTPITNEEIDEFFRNLDTDVEEDFSASSQLPEIEEAIEETQEIVEEVQEDAEIVPPLPENSPSLLIKEETSRFKGADWYKTITEQKVMLIGVGGIGSYVAFLLSRLNIRSLSIYDPDIVELGNMSGQFYGTANVGGRKAYEIARLLTNFSSYYQVTSFAEPYLRQAVPNIVICGLDNMIAREAAFDAWKNKLNNTPTEELGKCLFIDGRLAAEEFQVFCITGNDTYLMNIYKEKWLFPDSEAEPTICSYKQTSFCANMIGSVIANLFVNFVANQCNPLIPRELPFMTTYDAATMVLKTKMS